MILLIIKKILYFLEEIVYVFKKLVALFEDFVYDFLKLILLCVMLIKNRKYIKIVFRYISNKIKRRKKNDIQ